MYLRRVAEQRLTRDLVKEQVRNPIEELLEDEKKKGTIYNFTLDIDMDEDKFAQGILDIGLEVLPVGPAETFNLKIDTPKFNTATRSEMNADEAPTGPDEKHRPPLRASTRAGTSRCRASCRAKVTSPAATIPGCPASIFPRAHGRPIRASATSRPLAGAYRPRPFRLATLRPRKSPRPVRGRPRPPAVEPPPDAGLLQKMGRLLRPMTHTLPRATTPHGSRRFHGRSTYKRVMCEVDGVKFFPLEAKYSLTRQANHVGRRVGESLAGRAYVWVDAAHIDNITQNNQVELWKMATESEGPAATRFRSRTTSTTATRS